MMPSEAKMRLECLAMDMGVTVVGLHSAVLVEGEIVDCLFDVEPEDSGPLHFRFPLPQFVNKEDLATFGWWLAAPIDRSELTIH